MSTRGSWCPLKGTREEGGERECLRAAPPREARGAGWKGQREEFSGRGRVAHLLNNCSINCCLGSHTRAPLSLWKWRL